MLNRPAIELLADADDIAAMQLSDATLSHDAIMLLGYQRTKQISRRSRLGWQSGQPDALSAEATSRRREIFDGALLEIYQEYLPLLLRLTIYGIKPKKVIDIGCGQALNDLFLHRDFKPHFTLVDIETTPDQYHHWSDAGSGYASLENAKKLLHDNGVAQTKVVTINPTKTPAAIEKLTGDLVTSLYSCGFHYPLDEYVPLFDRVIDGGGAVCVDLRNNYTNNNPESVGKLLDGRDVTILYDDTKSKRVLVRK